jgi:hypothetical protein
MSRKELQMTHKKKVIIRNPAYISNINGFNGDVWLKLFSFKDMFCISIKYTLQNIFFLNIYICSIKLYAQTVNLSKTIFRQRKIALNKISIRFQYISF